MSETSVTSNRLLLWSAAGTGAVALLALIFLLSSSREDGAATARTASAETPALEGKPVGAATDAPPSPATSGVSAAKGSPSGGGETGETEKPVNFPETARALLEITDAEKRGEEIAKLLRDWVAKAPHEAADWVSGLPAGNLRADACGDLLTAWGERNPTEAAAWLSGSGLLTEETAGTLAGVWAGGDPEKAAAWAETLEDERAQLAARASIAGAWAEKEPQKAAAWVTTLPEKGRNVAALQVVQAWAERDGAAAAAWVTAAFAGKPKELEAPAAVLAMSWARESPAAVSRWLNTLPAGPAKEAAITAFAVSAAPKAPSSALAWAMSIGSQEQRNETVVNVCERWYDEAPESFRGGIAAALDAMEDPLMRRGIYEMLYERDPGFRDQLLALVEEPADSPEPGQTPGEPEPPPPAPEENK